MTCSEADCSRTGEPNYTTWYELIPAGPVTLKMHIAPGDVMAPAKMGKALDFVVAQYKARGLDVQVRPRVSHPKQNFVNLNFLINEHGTGGHD